MGSPVHAFSPEASHPGSQIVLDLAMLPRIKEVFILFAVMIIFVRFGPAFFKTEVSQQLGYSLHLMTVVLSKPTLCYKD